MPSAKNKRAKRVSDVAGNTARRLKSEINWAEKKLKKLLKRHEDGLKRWKSGKKSNKELDKTQGIMSGSKRHEDLKSHIAKMRTRLQVLKGK